MPNVFIVQDDHTKDFAPAKRFGRIQVLLSPTELEHLSTAELYDLMSDKLREAKEEDSLLLVGSPRNIGLAFLAIGDRLNSWNVLLWDKQTHSYKQETINV